MGTGQGHVHCGLAALRDWFGHGQHATLNCGAFTVDEVEYSGAPDKLSIKAVSASLTSPLRDTVRTKAWENYSLQGVAGEIAGKNGLNLLYQAPALNFERQEQREESDLGFLTRLAQERGINVKVHNGTLALYVVKDADAQPPRLRIPKKGVSASPKSYHFKESSQDTAYSGCEVNYMNPDTRETYSFAFDAEGKRTPLANEGAQKICSRNQRVESEAEARAFAQNALRDKNQSECTGSLELMGYPDLMAGTIVELVGFGKFNGNYFVEKAEHKVGSGYSTSAEIRRVLGY